MTGFARTRQSHELKPEIETALHDLVQQRPYPHFSRSDDLMEVYAGPLTPEAWGIESASPAQRQQIGAETAGLLDRIDVDVLSDSQ